MKKIVALTLSLLLVAALLASCSAKSTNDSAADYAPESAGYGGGAMTDNYASEESQVDYAAAADGDKREEQGGAEYGLKIIRRAYLSIETLAYDESYSAIIAAAKEFGGYVSNQYTSGGYYYGSDRYNTRYAELTLRIPADRYAEFIERGSSFGNVTSVSDSSDDITSQYIDTEARLTSLKAQEERLLAMLDRAATLEELILLEDHLSDIRYEIESYTSTLKTYENLVSYSTVTINLNEVSTITNTSDTFGARIKSALSGSWHSLVAFLQNCMISIIYLIPYLIILCIGFFFVRSIVRKRKAKRLAQYNTPAPTAPPTDDNRNLNG